jgi:hypothetical protein
MQTDRTAGNLRTYTLTIKGEPFQADRALADHGLGGDHVADLGHEQVVRVASRERLTDTLNRWFCEDIGREAPYPIGSLLYWSPDERAPLRTYRREQEGGQS